MREIIRSKIFLFVISIWYEVFDRNPICFPVWLEQPGIADILTGTKQTHFCTVSGIGTKIFLPYRPVRYQMIPLIVTYPLGMTIEAFHWEMLGWVIVTVVRGDHRSHLSTRGFLAWISKFLPKYSPGLELGTTNLIHGSQPPGHSSRGWCMIAFALKVGWSTFAH